MTGTLGSDQAVLIAIAGLFWLGLTAASIFWRWPAFVLLLGFSIASGHLQADLGIDTPYFRISALDILGVTVAVAATVRIISTARLDGIALLWIAAVALLAAAFLRGTMSFGLTAAAAYFRPFLYVGMGALYALSFPWRPKDIDLFCGLWMIAGAVLCVLCLLLWIFPDVFRFGMESVSQLAYQSRRVLPASSAMFLAEVGLIGLAAWTRGIASPKLLLLTAACLLIVLLLFHRSVWFTLLVALVVYVLSAPQAFLPVVKAVVATALVGLLVTAIAAANGVDLWSATVSSAVEEFLSNDSTLDWRVIGWKILVGRVIDGGPLSIFFGQGFGIGYDRYIEWSETQVSPHNVYVELFINGGLATAGIWLAYHVKVFRRLWSGTDYTEALIDARIGAALVAALVFYGLPYSPAPEQGLLMGVLGAMAASREAFGLETSAEQEDTA